MTRGLAASVVALALGSVAALAAGEAGTEPSPDSAHHEIEVRFDPRSRSITITDNVSVVGHERLEFNLAKWLRVTKARLDNRPVRVDRSGGLRLISLGDQGAHEVAFVFTGKVPALPSKGRHAASAFTSPKGAFIPNYADWLAASPGEQITYRLQIDLPAPFRAVATAALERETVANGRNRATFRSQRASEPPSLFAGPYKIAERRLGDIRIRTYFPGDLTALAPSYLEAAARYLAHFSGLIGAYPQAEFHVVAAPVPVGLGFPNLTYIGRRILPLPFIRERSLAHEVLHAWWGNGVGVDYVSGNWSEGLTTYLADYGLVERAEPAKARDMRLGWLRDYAALPPARDTSLEDFRSKGHDASQVVGYDKAAFLFHMLRGEIGDAAFNRGLETIWLEHRSSVASWTDLKRGFEKASGQTLGWFFDQWVERVGAPTIELEGASVRDTGQDHMVELSLSQPAPAYRLAVPVAIETASGPRRETLRFERARQTFHVSLGKQPLSLSIDPSHDLFRHLLPDEAPAIFRDVTLAETVSVLVATRTKAARSQAIGLARRLVDGEARIRVANPKTVPEGPLLVLGTQDEVAAFLAEAELPSTPAELATQGTARVWVTRRGAGGSLLVVEAADAKALNALLRPLPHYKRQSYLVFEGAKAVKRGVWPATASPLTVKFD